MSHKTITLAALCAAAAITASAQNKKFGNDFNFGGEGAGQGKFGVVIRDFAFDADDNLHVLDGVNVDAKTGEVTGNGLMQVFDKDGKFLREFSVMDAALADKNMPSRIALDKAGNVFITQPTLGEVWKYDAKGALVRKIPVPSAFAIARAGKAGGDAIVVIPKMPRSKDKEGADEMYIINPASGQVTRRVTLSTPILNCSYAAVDSKGNILALSEETRQVFKYAPTGRLLTTLGSGVRGGETDGSVMQYSIALDSKDNLYTMHGKTAVKFDAEFTRLQIRGNEPGFEFGQPWCVHDSHTPIAFDSRDRMWVVANSSPRARDTVRRPGIARATDDFFDGGLKGGIKEISAFTLGLKTGVASALPYDIAHEPGKPVEMAFTVAPAFRRVNSVTVEWQAVDVFKNQVGKGKFDLPLKDKEEAKAKFSFTPPAYGWYGVLCKISHKGEVLLNETRNIGVTPRFANMNDVREDGFSGGWDDIARQAFSGQNAHRTVARIGEDGYKRLEGVMNQAEQYPEVNIWVHFTSWDDAKPDNVRAYLERFKGRVKAWEFVNEPNIQGGKGSPENYIAMLNEAVPIIRELDPAAKIVGPNTCGIELGWLRKFFDLGGGDIVDVVSVHDYDGHEAFDPLHYTWKYGELRKLMEEHGVGDKPLWQTERGWGGVRGQSLMPLAQATRTLLHRDTLEILGIPSERNNLYYLNNGGYGGYPAFHWYNNGPHASAMGTRMREAQVKGKTFAGALDFGPTGNALFQGLRFEGGADGDLYIVRNLGTADTPAQFTTTAATAAVFDWAGNPLNAPGARPANGKLTLPLSRLPTYIRVPKGATLTPQPLDFGKNIAPEAEFASSLPGKVEALNNGIIESPHSGHPHGGTNGKAFYNEVIADFPQTIDMTFPAPREVEKMVVHGTRGDNAFALLLDFDVQYQNNAGKWVTLKKVKNDLPMSEMGTTPYALSYSWVDDTNIFVVPFDKPVKAAKFRLSINRVSYGLLADDPVALHCWGGAFDKRLCIREIEAYGK